MAVIQQGAKQKTLVITRTTFFDVDRFVAAIVLAKLIARMHGDSADVYALPSLPQKDLSTIVSPQDINFLEKLDADYFTISLDRGNAKIKEVKWEETGDKLKLLIFTEKGDLDTTKYAMNPGSPQYDLIYTLGLKTESDAKEVLGKFSNLWQAAETVNIDVRNENNNFAQSNFVYPEAKTLAEAVLRFATEKEIDLTNTEATELLAAIYWKTNSLRNRFTTPETLTAVQTLLQKGASLNKAVWKIFSSASIAEAKARQELYASLKLTNDKLAFAQVKPETAKLLNKLNPIFPDKNPLQKLKDADASFSLIPIASNKTLVLASAQADEINLKKLFGNYNYVGDPLQAELTFNLDVNQTEVEILKIIRKGSSQLATATTPKQVQSVAKPEPKPHQSKQITSQPAVAIKASELEPVTTPEPDKMPDAVEFKDAEPIVETKPEPVTTPVTSTATAVDPLAPATEKITPSTNSGTSNIAPLADTTPFGGMGFGGGGFGAPAADPLPVAGDTTKSAST